jgi:predicted enzyme related to lactoylglutathione lyase
MNFKNVYAGIMTTDIETAKEWYGKLIGRKSDYNPMKILHEWNFSNGGVLQLVEDKERAGYSSITIMVNNIDEISKELVEKNLPIGKVSEDKIAKTITINDPENNRITFAENMEGK